MRSKRLSADRKLSMWDTKFGVAVAFGLLADTIAIPATDHAVIVFVSQNAHRTGI